MNNRIKVLMIAIFFVLIMTVVGFQTDLIINGKNSDTDIATIYKTKCVACHTAKAEKFLNLTKTDEQFAEIILKGKKGEKPPFMPEFASKGITPEQAKALAAYMRALRTPDNANTNTIGNSTNANPNINANANPNINANVNPNINANANVNSNTFVNANANTNANLKANANTIVNVNANTIVNVNANPTNTMSGDALAVIYKTKCAACHTAKVEKFFDPAKTDAVHIETILKGKKGAKPPYMPDFAAKGITAEQAKALVAYMRSLKASGK
jgi:mono/diheme cytochrome c family protein